MIQFLLQQELVFYGHEKAKNNSITCRDVDIQVVDIHRVCLQMGQIWKFCFRHFLKQSE